MLNISHNQLHKKVSLDLFKSGRQVSGKKYYKLINRFLVAFALILIVTLFLPWTQNIRSQGQVTTLKPDQRPQTVQSQIPGRIEQWYVREGDFVSKGDTILRISEVNSEYFDSELLSRTDDQIKAKSSSAEAYKGKIVALKGQIRALQNEKRVKLNQAENKIKQAYLGVKSDSIALEAAKTNIGIARKQFDRIQMLQEEGLKAVRDVEEKRLKLQEAEAKLISVENKYLASKNEVLNVEAELIRIQTTYDEKIAKAQGDIFSAQSSQYDTEAQVTKLQNAYSNYKMRSNLQFVVAPQDGFINKALRSGIGETFKEGEQLVSIMPSNYDLAVETYVSPLDLPLIHLNERVRVQFDGWPAIVFSGWPNVSYGTYGARIVAVENFISDNGKYRVLLAPDPDDHPWPEAIRVGSGARTMALLEDVPIWYELWRQLNGFPNDYYQPESSGKQSEKKEK